MATALVPVPPVLESVPALISVLPPVLTAIPMSATNARLAPASLSSVAPEEN